VSTIRTIAAGLLMASLALAATASAARIELRPNPAAGTSQLVYTGAAGEVIDQESWAIVCDPRTDAVVLDPACEADVPRDLTGCVVILTGL